MRTKRRELKEVRQGRRASAEEYVNTPRFASGQLSKLDSYYELIKMIAGAGVGFAGTGGVGMLRARRRDISIKPNRKLDRKSSRGVIYENEELRLRAININAEVEQGQNDIKKLRRENEQLRREIWSLRDEYDKLEEILKKQKSREESDEPEVRSETEIAGSECSDCSEDEEDEDEEEDDDDDEEESESDDDDDDDDEAVNDQEVRHENAENQKISTEKSSVTPTIQQHHTLPVVHEEEEPPKREKDQAFVATVSVEPVATGVMQQPAYPYHTTSFEQPYPITTTTNFSYPIDSPFVFPPPSKPDPYSTVGNGMLMTTYPQVHHHQSPPPQQQQQQQQQQPVAVTQTSSFDMGIFEHPHVATPPPPPGWQSSLNARSSPLNFATGFPRTQSPLLDAVGPTLKPPEEFRVVENGQQQQQKSLAERRRAFFKQYSDSQRATGSRDNSGLESSSSNKAPDPVGKSRLERPIDTVDGLLDASPSTTFNDTSSQQQQHQHQQPKHFFAPLPAKCRSPCNGEAIRPMDDVTMASLSDNGNSPSSEKTGSTVISRGRYERGLFDITANGNLSSADAGNRHVVSFFGNDNFRFMDNAGQCDFFGDSNNPLTKSLSCQDLNARVSFAENLSMRNEQLAKSDSTLDNMSIKAFKSQLNITLRQPGSRKSLSSDTPEIPKLPSIDYKLFNNPFLQNFEQAYQNFPMRTEGQSPLSLQVCESPVSGAGYSSPVRMQPTFTSPNEPEYAACKRKDLERLRLMIPNNKIFDGDRQEYQVTSFENPSPHTLQIPPMTPYELEAIRRMPTGTTPLGQSPMPTQPTSRLYQNVPFTPGMRHDSTTKISTMTQTSPDDQPQDSRVQAEVEQPKKRRSRKEKGGSMKEKGGSVKRRSPSTARRSKELLKKQSSVASAKDIPETPRSHRSESEQQDKNESRSSSSGQESPKKDQSGSSSTKRVSLYFSARKRPSLTSSRTSRSRSVENSSRHLGRSDNHLLERDDPAHERERTNSISSREARDKQQRRTSTSSGSVPWCACWGNGCI